MKILLVTHRLRGGGAEEVARLWSRAIPTLGHDLEVLVLEKEQDQGGASPVHAVIHRAADHGQYGFLGRVRYLRELVRAREIDVVLTLQTYPNLLALFAGFGLGKLRVVISEHNVPSIYLANGSRGHRVQRRLARVLYRRADFAIAVSHAVATDLMVRHAISAERCAVIPNGVAQSEDAQVLNDHMAPKAIKIVIPARLSWQKRPEMAADIATELRHRGHVVDVTWIGDPVPGESEIERQARTWFSVQSWRDDWWNSTPPDSIVLLPSSIEGFGNILVQAAQHGLVSVAGSTALGVGDAIVSGLSGFLSPVDSVTSFADAVELAAELQIPGAIESWLGSRTSRTTARALERVFESV